MPYTLKHTAEELDRKLYLIDENKNRLPYPYEEAIPTGLEDVGDGSILTVDVTSSKKRALLNTCTLPAGKYIVSLDTTNIIDEITTAVANPGFSLEVVAADTTLVSTDNFVTLELADETAVAVYLNIPTAFDANILVKPQIEPGETKTTWVPYMGTIGSYVDERFNSTNAKIKAAVKTLKESKVDKVEGKDLSTNDYTTDDKIKLAGIEDGAEKNIQPDWNQNDETKADYVKNRTHYAVTTSTQKDILKNWNLAGAEYSPDGILEYWHEFDKDFGEFGAGVLSGEIYYGNNNVYEFSHVINKATPCIQIGDYEDNNLIRLGDMGGGPELTLRLANITGIDPMEFDDGQLYIDVALEEISETVHTLDEKFIPSSIAKVSQLDKVKSDTDSSLTKINNNISNLTTKISKAVTTVNYKTPNSSGSVNIAYEDLEDKPFGVTFEEGYTPIGPLDGSEYSFVEDSDGIYVKEFGPYNGDAYFADGHYVTWDGVTYECFYTPEYYDEDDYGQTGRIEDLEFSVYPFCIEYRESWSNGIEWIKVYTNQPGKHTIKVCNWYLQPIEVINALDEKFIPDTIARKSDIENFTYSWNDLTDKPFGEQGMEPIIWDENTEGLVSFDILADMGGDGTTLAFKVSDLTPSKEEFLGGILTIRQESLGERALNLTDETLMFNEEAGVLLHTGLWLVVIYADKPMAQYTPAGIYFLKDLDGVESTLSLAFPESLSNVKPIDEKFIPDTIARATDIQAEVDRAKAVEADLQGQIDVIVDNPETADTIDSIKEFTTYIEQHGEIADGFRTDIAGLQTEVGTKVDKEAGKGLSTNDFNNNYKKTLDTIKPGTGDNSIVINDGTASGAYSIAGGTTNKDFVDGVTGGIAGALTTLHPSEAIGELSIALGADNKAITAGSMALGYDNIAGGKGYYVTAINVATKTITLSTKQTSTSNPGTVSWSKGDRLFFVNDERYFLEIASISGNVVTLVDMPFTSLMSTNSLTGKPNDRAIINLDKPESGTINIGWGAMSTGIQNEAVGSSSYAMGYKNIVAGDFGTAFGMENIVGYSAFATGNNNKASGKRSFASGDNNIASGALAHAEGGDNTASGDVAHVEGSNNKATGWASHAEGGYTTASASKAHAEGHETTASGINSHAEGKSTTASGENAHAEGQGNTASGIASHAEGYENKVSGNYAHVEGRKTEATKEHAHAEGYNTRAYGACAHTEGHNTEASGEDSHAEGKGTNASSYTSHAEGLNSIASGQTSHAEGISTESSGKAAHTEGELTKATKDYAHAEGYTTQADGYAGHAEGGETVVSKSYGHAEGYKSTASGRAAHAENSETIASGDDSHAEGYKTTASGGSSHAEGGNTVATGSKAHAEGHRSNAQGENAHAEGKDTVAKSINTHAEGFKTIANGAEQHVQGRYNIEDTDKKYAHIVGNGTGDDNRSNAHTVDWNGNAWFAGSIKIGNTVLTEAQLIKILNFIESIEEVND